MMPVSYLRLPRRAAWCKVLKPLLFVMDMSTCASSNNWTMSSRFLEIASWRGVSPSESCKMTCDHMTLLAHPLITCREVWQLLFSKTWMTLTWPLLMATCRGVWWRRLRAFRSAPASANSWTIIGSSPNEAWWIALSPSLSCGDIIQ